MCLNYLDECTEAKKVAAEKQIWYKITTKEYTAFNLVPMYASIYKKDLIKLNVLKINIRKEKIPSNYDRYYANGFHFYDKKAALNFIMYAHVARAANIFFRVTVLECKVEKITDFGVDDMGYNCVAQEYTAIKALTVEEFCQSDTTKGDNNERN